MDPRHIIRLSATELARHLMSNELTSVQVTEAFLARLDELATTTRPMAVRMDMDARRQASDSDARRKAGKLLSPMDGVPMTVKESIDIAGKPSTLGLPSRKRHKADADAVVVSQLRGLGAVFLGKTNVSQGLLFHECSNPIYGTTTNPHATTRTPGGSSGGEAAAIASYGSPMGIGTDIGGSIRVPAHFTGICGLKPTVDRWSNIGSNGVSPGQEIVRGQMGPMARTVDDIMLLMQAVSPERASRMDPRVNPLPIGDPRAIDVKKLRVGFFLDDNIVSTSPAVQRAVQLAAQAMRDAGAHVQLYSPVLVADAVFTYLAALSSDGGATLRSQVDRSDLEPALELLWDLVRVPQAARAAAGKSVEFLGDRVFGRMLTSVGERSVQDYWTLTRQARVITMNVLNAWNKAELDVVLCPTHATPALPIGASRDFALGGALSMRFNLTNFPAGVVPATTVRPDEESRTRPSGRLESRASAVDVGSAGLPVGVQVVGRPWREDQVLYVMKAIEARLSSNTDYPRIAL